MRATNTVLTWLHPIGLLLIFLIGYSNLLLQRAQQKKLTHWTNKHVVGYSVCIQKVYHPLNCKALITHIKDNAGWHNTHASIQLYFRKQSDYKPKKGDRLLIRGAPVHSLPSESMQQADPFTSLHYSAMYRHVLKQVDQDFICLQPFHERGKWAAAIKQWCGQTLQKRLKGKETMALVARLLWGAKETVDPGLEKAYADTGTIHVLAISGLHVGMLYLLIKAVFSFLFRKIGLFMLSELCTLLWLWLYAGLCDFAPPILRETIMITMARLGFLMGRGSNPYNGLLASAFALLLWEPFVLFNCGFQLSYVATLGILYLQPLIHRFIALKNRWLQKVWTATTLSIAAQASTLPLILYYFKQFPLYFIIANWLVVPAIFAILVLSLALLVGSHLPIVGMLLGFTLEKLIFVTNALVCWMAKWPISTLASCCINDRSACLLYIILLALCLFIQYKQLIYPIIISLSTIFYTVNRMQHLIAKQKNVS